MPSPENPQHQEGEPQEPGNEQQPSLFYLASRFPQAFLAQNAYLCAQQVIFNEKCDLSAYRFQQPQVDAASYVAVLGEPPPEALVHRLERLLAAGEPIELPEEVLRFFVGRRKQAAQLGSWVEGHYRPGQKHRLR